MEANVEKLVSKLDDKKLEELSEFLDQIPVINDTLKRVKDLRDSGALDSLINLSYIAKVLKDMLNDEAIQNLGDMLSSFASLMTSFKGKDAQVDELMNLLPVATELMQKVKQLKDSGTLDVLVNFSYSLKSLRDALNDEAMENLANQIGHLLELTSTLDTQRVEGLKNILGQSKELSEILSRLIELKNSGTLDVLVNLAYGLKSLRDALNDEAITNLGTTLSLLFDFLPKGLEFLERAMDPVFANMINVLTSDEAKKIISNPPNITIGGLIKSMSDQDVQRGLGILISMAKVLGKNYKI
ncbi:DUF1641 domain-containing protein [Candidatus Acidianus copahuensis]|nr:DUF1641 domain-containing protein [Candidatus Acidianus copahuensis]